MRAALAKWRFNASRAGRMVTRAASGMIFERRKRSRMGERVGSAASTCSNLNFSAQAIMGRQTNWSISTMIATMTPKPQTMERVSPALAAVWR